MSGKSMIVWWQQRNGHKGLTGIGLLLMIVWAVWAIGWHGLQTTDHPGFHLFLYGGLLVMVVGLFIWPDPPPPSFPSQ
jgi:hypothetical protein